MEVVKKKKNKKNKKKRPMFGYIFTVESTELADLIRV